MFKFLVALLIVSAVPRFASAQAAADNLYIGVQSFGSSELNERQGEVEQRGIVVQAGTPALMLAPGTILRLGAGYRRLTVDFDQGAALTGEPSARNLTSIDAGISLTQILSAQWSLTAVFAPRIRSDFSRDFSSKDVQYGGAALASYTFGPRYQHTLSFGVALNTRATLIPVLPIATYSYRGERFFFEGAATGVSGLVRFDRLEAGIFFNFDDSFYHVEAPDNAQLTTGTFLRATNMTAGPLVNVRIASDLWLETRAGYSFVRFLRYNDEDLNRIDRGINADPNPALMFQVGLGFGARKPPRPAAKSGS